jgi:hypothetical protein
LYELFGTPDTPRINANIINPASKHELFRDWLLASSLIKETPKNVQDALTKMTGPRRRSVMSLMLEVFLIADKTNALTETMFRVEPLIASAGVVRRNRLNARLAPDYYFNHILSVTTLNDEFCESPWLKAVISALMCGPTADSTKEAINEIAFQRVSTVPLSIQQTLGESAFWLLLDVQDAVYRTPKNIEKLAQHVFDCPEPWAELAKHGYNYWIHYRQRLAELPEVEQIARGAPVLKTNQSLSERKAVEKLPPPLQARYWLSLEKQIDYQDNIADRAGLNVTWLAQHCRELSLRLMHRLIVKHLVPDRSGEQQDFTALLEYAKKQAPLLLPELFNVLPKNQVYDALEDQGVLDQFVDQVTPIAAAQFFRHVKPSGGPHDATCQEWRERVMQSLRNNSWCKKADPAEMQRLFKIGLVEPLPEAKKNRWQQSMHMRDAGLLKRVGVQIECTRECVEAWVNQAHSSKEYFYALDNKAITPANAINGQGKPVLQKVIDELNESAILTLLQRTGVAEPAQEIKNALEAEAERRFNEAIENFDTTNSQHNWCAIIRIFQGKLRVDEIPEGGQKWLPMLSQAMKVVLLRHGLITIKELQIAEQASHAKGDRLTSYTYLVSHRDDDHCWLLYWGEKTQPMFPTRKYSDVSSGESRRFEINVGDAVLLRSHGSLIGARHVACACFSRSLEENSNEMGDRSQEISLSLDERLKLWICRVLHPVYREHKCFNKSTPFNHDYWGRQGVSIRQWLIPTQLAPESSLESLNRVLKKGWFVVKLSYKDDAQQFWKCRGPLMGKDIYLRSRDIIGKINGQPPKVGDFLLARIQVHIHFEKSDGTDGYVPVLVPVVCWPFAYLLPESLREDTESAWWKSGSI